MQTFGKTTIFTEEEFKKIEDFYNKIHKTKTLLTPHFQNKKPIIKTYNYCPKAYIIN